MVPAESTLCGCSLESRETCRRGTDPVAYAVRVALVVYLSPVLLLVTAVGLTGLAVGQVARLAGKILGLARNPEDATEAAAGSALPPRPRAIGDRPILAVRHSRSRVPR